MKGRLAILGTGRLGPAMARLAHDAGYPMHSIVGRSLERAREAAGFVGVEPACASVEIDACAGADLVLVAVRDDVLEQVASSLEPVLEAGQLVMHCSGASGLEILPRGEGVMRAALHPACPVPDWQTGLRSLPGAHALCEADPAARERVECFAKDLGLIPILVSEPIDRALYHAACALAANGLTALVASVEDCLRQASPDQDLHPLAATLLRDALQLSGELGPRDALSGAVLRGDVQTLAGHLEALETGAPTALSAYRALMIRALDLAVARGLPSSVQQQLRSTLETDG